MNRHQHAADPRVKVAEFSIKTSTGVLRKHLYERHADAWITGCDKLGIVIKAKEAMPYVNDYRRRKGHFKANTQENAGYDPNQDHSPKKPSLTVLLSSSLRMIRWVSLSFTSITWLMIE